MKNIVLALTGLVLLSSCVCDCGQKHERAQHAQRPHFKRPAGFQGPKNVSEMKQGD